MKIVAFHQGALGDFLLTLSALEGLAAARPETRIDFWSKPEHVSLLEGKHYLGCCRTLDGPLIPSLLHESTWETADIPDFLSGADLVLIFGQSGTRGLAGRLSVRLGRRVEWIQSFPKGNGTTHASDFVRDQLIRLGFPVERSTATIVPPAREIGVAASFLRERGIMSRPIFIHPGSGGRKKIWPLGNWQAIVTLVRLRFGIPVLLSVGPADLRLDAFAHAFHDPGIFAVRGLSILRLAALISMCRCYMGSDSGVSHLAAALGIPSVVVFGPTDPAVWAPRGREVRVVRRSWDEADVFAWQPGEPETPPDEGLAAVISEVGKGRVCRERKDLRGSSSR